jgi:hypothetical protein
MPINLANISNAQNTALGLSNLILVTPQDLGFQPQNPREADGTPSKSEPPPALLFHFEGEQSLTIEADVTDHYVEDNTAVQDHIALKPEIVNTQGFIGELNNVPPKGLGIVKEIADRLTTVTAFAPKLSATAQNIYNQASTAYSLAKTVAKSAVSAWNTLSGNQESNVSIIGEDGLVIGENQNKQQVAFQQFYGYMQSRTLFTVQTPWCVIQDMALVRLHPIQDADSKLMTTFEVSFKRIRTAKTQIANRFGIRALDGRAAQQASSLLDLGTSTPLESDSLTGAFGSVFG